MRKILILTCGILMMSSVAMGNETSCAGGSGTLVTGKSGYKYCKSNQKMNWWNAIAWCDALEKRLIDLDKDCGCDVGVDCIMKCPELEGVGTDGYAWTIVPFLTTTSYTVTLPSGKIGYSGYLGTSRSGSYYAICK